MSPTKEDRCDWARGSVTSKKTWLTLLGYVGNFLVLTELTRSWNPPYLPQTKGLSKKVLKTDRLSTLPGLKVLPFYGNTDYFNGLTPDHLITYTTSSGNILEGENIKSV